MDRNPEGIGITIPPSPEVEQGIIALFGTIPEPPQPSDDDSADI